MGDYILGRVDLFTAAQVSGMPREEILTAVRKSVDRLADEDGAPAAAEDPLLSVVVPVFNNETTLRELHHRLTHALVSLGTFEIVLVDDGSSDGSAAVARELCDSDSAVRFVRLSRNFGQQAALTAGIDSSRGSAVVMMDADLQDPPEMIPDLVRAWRAGNEVVCTVRQNRKESLLKRGAYSLFYRVFRYLAEVDMPLDSGEFSLLDRKVVDTLRSMPERSRFLRGMRSWSGFRQTSVPYDRPPRLAGSSQYTLRRLVRLAVDGLLGFSSAPLRLVSFAGVVTALLGIVLLGTVVVLRLSTPDLPIGWTSTLAGLLLVGGVQLMTVGVVGAYVARIYTEVKDRPLYVAMERVR